VLFCYAEVMTHLLDPKVTIETRDGRPCLVSERFGDLYFSAENGLAETELVFIDANDLPCRMASGKRVVIAETGFGTGLNFLAVLKHWISLGDAAPPLHYITTEIAPLPPEVIRAVLSPFDEIADLLDDMTSICRRFGRGDIAAISSAVKSPSIFFMGIASP